MNETKEQTGIGTATETKAEMEAESTSSAQLAPFGHARPLASLSLIVTNECVCFR